VFTPIAGGFVFKYASTPTMTLDIRVLLPHLIARVAS
jgi:hypothetical protein